MASRCPNIDLGVVVDLNSLRCARPNSVLISWGNDSLLNYVILISIGWGDQLDVKCPAPIAFGSGATIGFLSGRRVLKMLLYHGRKGC